MSKNVETVYGLTGYPLGHSFSKAYFTEKFAREGIDARYENFEIDDIAMLPGLVSRIDNLRGFNVTIPYKQAVIPYLAELDESAASVGAVNVVRVTSDKSLKGYNSDIYGFVESLKPMLGATDRSALVLGVGGASLAVCHGLRSLGIQVSRVSRRAGAGEYVYADLTPELVAEHTVIVNTTPLGMYPKVDAAPDIPYSGVSSAHVCFDLVYNPAETRFMQLCAEQGAKVSNGLRMLHLQAEKAWEIWQQPE